MSVFPHVRVAPPPSKGAWWKRLGPCFWLAIVPLTIAGCASTKEGLQREQAFHDAFTNDVALLDGIVLKHVPPPWNGVAEGLVAAAAAAIALWTRSLHRRTTALEQGKSAESGGLNASPGQQSRTDKPLNTSS